MRVLFTTTPGRGHYLAMTPLASAFAERGHEILWATGPDGREGLRGLGFDAVSCGLPEGATSQDLHARPDMMALPAIERPRHYFAAVFGPDRAVPMLNELVPIIDRWKPSLLVCDTTEFAGPIAAAIAGVPNVSHSFGHPRSRANSERAAEFMAPVWSAHGLDPRPDAGIYEHVYLDIYPRSLQTSRPSDGARVQPVRPAPVVDRVLDDGRPLVYVTFGTVFSRDLRAHRTVLEGIRDLPVRVLITLGPGADSAGLGDQPHNVEVAEFVPQREVLPRAAAIVSHAGSGTFLAGLAAGLPQVLLPQGADQFDNAAAGEAAGAAIRVDPERLDAATVRDALLRVLGDPTYAMTASALKDEIRAMATHDEAVGVLEDMVGG